MIKVGILTSGGDCQGLNGAMYGLVKGLTETNKDKVEIYGILDGYTGLINGDYKKMKPEEFENILNLGGSILGNSRQPFKKINEPDEKGRNKVEAMISNYKKMELDCLVVLGGNGSHKTANLLSEKGLNIVTLPKTIDNDINGTDMTFGFQSAIDIATRTLDELHTTAKSHGRIMIAEIMGNKAGYHLEAELSEKIDGEVRVVVPGHIQRGGNPCAFDRVLTSRIGVKGAELILNKQYGRMVAVQSNNITSVPLSTAVEKPKRVDPNDEIIRQVRMLGICLGD